MKYILATALLLSGQAINAMDDAHTDYIEQTELNGKCLECIFSSPENYYCASLNTCIQSGNNMTKFSCEEGVNNWMNNVSNCSDTINTKCAYFID